MAETLRPLIEAARTGDRAAINRLAGCVDRFVRLFSGSLTHHLRRTQGSTIDFVNEGLAEAMARLDTFEYRSDEEFYGWVARLIKSRILDALRAEERQKRAGRPQLLATDDGVPAPDPSPSRVVSAAEVRDVIKGLLLEIQVDHAIEMEAVVLKVFEDCSWPEVQAKMGLSSLKRARTLCAHGLDLLRPRVEASIGENAFDDFVGL